MINVRFNDFEKYREDLLVVSKSLTKSKSGMEWQYNSALAEDIVQDSYIKFHKMVEKGFVFETEDHLRQLLVKNVWRLSRNARANNKGVVYKSKEHIIDLDLLPEKLHIFAKNDAISNMEIQSIYTAIHSMKSKNDIDIILLAIEGYNCSEIALKMNKTKRAIVSSLFRSREQLRGKLNIGKYFCNANKYKNSL